MQAMWPAVQEAAITMWGIVAQMAPFLLFGFFLAGVLSQVLKSEWIVRHLGQRGFGSVLKAAVFGVPLPICSCGVIPLMASLRQQGASKGATTSFLISTPQTGADSIAVTYGLMGPVFAAATPITAFLGGLIGGTLTDRLAQDASADAAADKAQPAEAGGGHCCAHDAGDAAPGPPAEEAAACHMSPEKSAPADKAASSCCAEPTQQEKGVWGRFTAALRHAYVVMPADIARPLAIGLALAAVIGASVPEDFFTGWLGNSWFTLVVMMFIGIPLYGCSTGSVPIAAALIMKGVSPGAALVFLITGPATNAATVTTVWQVLGARVAAIYLGTVAACALTAGTLLNWIFAATAWTMTVEHAHEHTSWLGHASAVALLLVLAYAFIPKGSQGSTAEGQEAEAAS